MLKCKYREKHVFAYKVWKIFFGDNLETLLHYCIGIGFYGIFAQCYIKSLLGVLLLVWFGKFKFVLMEKGTCLVKMIMNTLCVGERVKFGLTLKNLDESKKPNNYFPRSFQKVQGLKSLHWKMRQIFGARFGLLGLLELKRAQIESLNFKRAKRLTYKQRP